MLVTHNVGIMFQKSIYLKKVDLHTIEIEDEKYLGISYFCVLCKVTLTKVLTEVWAGANYQKIDPRNRLKKRS